MRNVSGVGVLRGRTFRVRIVVGNLQKARRTRRVRQTVVAFEDMPSVRKDRLSGERSQFVPTIRLVEGAALDTGLLNFTERTVKLPLVTDATDDKVRMVQFR